MPTIRVTPASVQERLDHAQPGQEIVLEPGTYRERLRLVDRAGTVMAPIVVRAEPGALLDGGVTAEEFRPEANRLAKSVADQGRYPGLYPWMGNGQLVLQRCRHVELVDLEIARCWPTLIALDDVQDIGIRGAKLCDGTFAIGALGRKTHAITIEHCSWLQDQVRGRIWREIAWARIHGDPGEDGPVDLVEDWRLFDGDFFRGFGIRGGVRIRYCTVECAFNAVHLFNEAGDSELARDVEVAHCLFREIRDNVLEAETAAHNWWFHHNEIINAHKWFSLELKRSGFLYIFANCGWYDCLQGPAGDDHATGGMFKTPKTVLADSGHHHVFHNSFVGHGDYLRNWRMTRFAHQNNAIRLSTPGGPLGAPSSMFGDIAAAPDNLDRRFTTDWPGLDIGFAGDVVDHPTWPDIVRERGYPVQSGSGADPAFLEPHAGRLQLADGSPATGVAVPIAVALIDGKVWRGDGSDVGAWQGEAVLEGPRFVPTPALVS